MFDQNKKTAPGQPLKNKKKMWRIVIFVGVILLIIGGVFAFKTGFILNKVTGGKANIFTSLIKSLPGADQTLKGESDGRINVLLLGMRGENVPGGGLLADTIMVLSIHPKDEKKEGDQSKASLISIPRDLYIDVPEKGHKSKINSVFAYGEERARHSGGSEDMRKAVGEITGLDIPYAITINFKGFVDLVNALGGITVSLPEAFNESLQFHEPQVCDANVYTVPTRPPQFQHKYYTRQDGSKYIAKSYPLCYNHDEECGGNFSLPQGENKLDGNKALCYARSRYASSDFDRARRQQQVIQEIKETALSAGTLTDFSKINGILDSLGNNVSTNMAAWEMKRFFDLYQKIGDVQPTQKVLENSEEGLLYAPEMTKEAGYHLVPRGNNYDKIRELFRNSLN